MIGIGTRVYVIAQHAPLQRTGVVSRVIHDDRGVIRGYEVRPDASSRAYNWAPSEVVAPGRYRITCRGLDVLVTVSGVEDAEEYDSLCVGFDRPFSPGFVAIEHVKADHWERL